MDKAPKGSSKSRHQPTKTSRKAAAHTKGKHMATDREKWKDEIKELSKEQLQDIRDAFKAFDRNKDGKISIVELKSVMQVLGNNPTENDVRRVMKEADKDGNSRLDFDEFAVLMAKYLKEPEEEELELLESFRIFDKDNSGYIEISEIKELMKSIGEKLTDEQLEEIFSRGDVNNDGRLDYQEFTKLMTKQV